MSAQDRRVSIVTGGSRGIGRRIAERLAERGDAVVVAYQNGASAADDVVSGIIAAGGAAISVQSDVADEASVSGLFDKAKAEFGGVDTVVHAAAVLTTKPLVDLTVDEMDAMLHTNLRGTLLVDRAAASTLRAGGSIVNISTAVTKNFAPGYTAYGATKAGLEAITKILAKELAGRDITVNAVAPGPTETEMFARDLADSGDGAAMRQALVDMIPLRRIGTPDDIAEAVLALTGPVRWVNGQTVHTSGGLV
ncbi:SDR family oxidoreductase [Streptomyces sp. NPDC026672]|uniref:SDR family oxidoreductase n=1 Tax=unclassified Streptomyces TaxID=2593676 RepID=UPI00340C695D